MASKAKEEHTGFNRRGWALTIAALASIFAYLVGSRAIDTGSLQQYAVTAILIIIVIIELYIAFRKYSAKS